MKINKVALAAALMVGVVLKSNAQTNLITSITVGNNGTLGSGLSVTSSTTTGPVNTINITTNSFTIDAGTSYRLRFNLDNPISNSTPNGQSIILQPSPFLEVSSGISVSSLPPGTTSYILSSADLANMTGTRNFSITLRNSSGAFTLSNLFFGAASQVSQGPSAADTQQSLNNTASALRSAYALQSAVLVNGFSYDCPVFDKNGICISTGGRYSTTNANSLSTTSALLIGAYRLSNQIRLGAYVDQNLSSSGNTVNLNNSKPMVGVFGVWNEREDGIGAEVKVSAGYGAKDTTITRQVVGTSEAGSGGSTLNTTGAQITAKYNIAAIDKTIVSPYVGIRYTQNRMNGYVEATNSNVTAPLTYSALNTDATTAILGVGVKYQLDSAVALLASAGVENDLNINNGTYSATGVTGLTAINFNSNPAKTRATLSAGAHYDIDKRQRVSLTGIYREEAYRSVNTTAVFATYMVGF